MTAHLSLVLLLSAAGLAIGRYVCHAIYHLYFSPLKAIPGPRVWAFSKMPYFMAHWRGDINARLAALHEQYGLVLRIGPRDVSFATEAAWRDAFALRPGHEEFMKADVVRPASGVPGILHAERADHSRFRRLLAHAFSEKGLRDQEGRVVGYVDLLIKRLRERAPSGPQDMVCWLNWTTFDMIGDLAFGESFGCLENTRPHAWIEAVFGNLKYILYSRMCTHYDLIWLAKFLTPMHVVELRKVNAAYSKNKIAQRMQVAGPRGDFFDHVLKKSPGEGGMTVDELESNAQNIVLGGSETTATLLSGTIHLLLTHPDVLTQLQHEVRSQFASEDEITIVAVSQLSFMLAVLQEAMRIYPPVPIPQQRRVPAGGEFVAGIFLPEKTVLQFSLYAAQRHSANFVRPNEFLPERWMLSVGEKERSEFAHDRTGVHQPFSVGPRNCIGRNLAYAEMRLILAKLLYNFDMSFPREVPDQSKWISEQRTWFLWEKGPLWVNLVARRA